MAKKKPVRKKKKVVRQSAIEHAPAEVGEVATGDAQLVPVAGCNEYELTFTYTMRLGTQELISAVSAMLGDSSLNHHSVTLEEAKRSSRKWYPTQDELLEALRQHMPGNLGAGDWMEGDVLWEAAVELVRQLFPKMMRGYKASGIDNIELTAAQAKATYHMARTRRRWVKGINKVVARALVRKGIAKGDYDEPHDTAWELTAKGRQWVDANPEYKS